MLFSLVLSMVLGSGLVMMSLLVWITTSLLLKHFVYGIGRDNMKKHIGKHIKILNDEWSGEFTKGNLYEIIQNIHDIPCVVNDSGTAAYDILCYTDDYEIVENTNLDKE